MSRLKVVTELKIYETDGKDTTELVRPKLKVISHWNRSSLVVLEINGKKYTVVGEDLKDAVDNAENSGGL